jgi:two-component system LytT family sensor kinase
MNAAQRRAWWWYAAAWVPVAAFFSVLMAKTGAPTLRVALIQGVSYVIPVAVLGVGVWRLTSLLDWPPRSIPRFLGTHVAGAVLFSLTWIAVEIALIARAQGFRAAIETSRIFAGFEALEGIFIYGLIAAVSYVIRIATRLREQEARTARADALRMQAELAALRGQLNPHFLFNTLHTLTALVRRDPATAENALERFGDMLRYVLDVKRSAREDVTLGDELEFVRNYLSLEQLRFGDRLRVIEHVDPDALDCVLPSLTLQPLIENAIKYGVAPRAAGGSVEISASLDDDILALEIRDDGPGASSDVTESASGVGLRAVRQRLDVRYPGASRFSVQTAPNTGFVVRLGLPAHSRAEAAAPV